MEGVKTIAYEFWEDLGFEAPDNIGIPAGSGSNVLVCDIGFGDLLRIGQIRRKPRLFVIQPENCCPIHHAFSGSTSDTSISPTIAEGAAVSKPIRLDEVVQATRRSGGRTLAVSEAEINVSLKTLGRAGFHVEPTCAMAAAALDRLIDDDLIKPQERTVVIMTGIGLKATQMIQELLAE